MSQRRTRIDIINDILLAIRKNGKLRPTHVMYKANLSHSSLNEYLGELMQKGLVEELIEKRSKYLIITEKGASFITQFRQMKEFQGAFGL